MVKNDMNSKLTIEEGKFLAGLLNEKVADLSCVYDNRILSIQKKLKLFPRKERWVMCGIMYVTVIEHEGANMKWLGRQISCHEKVERPYSDANLMKQGKNKNAKNH